MSAPIAAARPHAVAVTVMLADGFDALGLRADGAYRVYESRVAGDVALICPYFVLHPGAGYRTSERITGRSDRFDQDVQVTVVGRNQTEVLAAADAACEVLLDRRPAVAGRATWRIRQIPGTPPVPVVDRTVLDPATGEPVLYLPLLFGVASTPAPTS